MPTTGARKRIKGLEVRDSLKHRYEHTILVRKSAGPPASSHVRDLSEPLFSVADFMMLP